MELSQSIELAGRLAVEAPMTDRLILGPAATRRYWDASRRRGQAWSRILQEARQRGLAASGCGAILAEIFVTEMLTCLAAARQAHAAKRLADATVAAVALKVFEQHQQHRHEAMMLMLDRADVETAAVAAADRLRRRAERWTDVLLGCCPARLDLELFAHDPARAEDFRVEQDPFTGAPRRSLRRSLLMTSLRQAFPPDQLGMPNAEHAPLHRAVHAAIESGVRGQESGVRDQGSEVGEDIGEIESRSERRASSTDTARPADGIRFSRLYRREQD